MTFDEQSYLLANPDVADAVRQGRFLSGSEHYERFGRTEDRPLNLDETRNGKILKGLDLATMSGIEIGALAAPLVKKSQGRIRYVDHAPTEEIVAKYRAHETVEERDIVPVDAVWGDKSLRAAIGGDERFDYVLASHVVEHVPDLVTWLAEIKEILKPSGTLRLYVPDKRFEFDYLRTESSLSDVVDAFVRKARTPLPRMLIDYHTLVKPIGVTEAWAGRLEPRADWADGCRNGIALARDTIDNGTYHDVHCWIFTPRSFATLMAQCAELGLVQFRCEAFHDTARLQLEFMVGLAPCDDATTCVASWDRMAALVEDRT